MYTINAIRENLDCADIYYKDIKISVRVILDEEQIFVPKTDALYDIEPEIYFVIKYINNDNAELIGYFTPEDIDKTQGNDLYYFVDDEKVKKFTKIKKVLNDLTPKKRSTRKVLGKDEVEQLFVKLLDREITDKEFGELIYSAGCNVRLRERLSEFENFEFIAYNTNEADLAKNDAVLDVIGAQENYQEVEEETLAEALAEDATLTADEVIEATLKTTDEIIESSEQVLEELENNEEPVTESEVEQEVEAEPEQETEIEEEVVAEQESESVAEPEEEPVAELDVEPKPNLEIEEEPITDAEVETEVDEAPVVDLDSESELEFKQEPAIEAEAELQILDDDSQVELEPQSVQDESIQELTVDEVETDEQPQPQPVLELIEDEEETHSESYDVVDDIDDLFDEFGLDDAHNENKVATSVDDDTAVSSLNFVDDIKESMPQLETETLSLDKDVFSLPALKPLGFEEEPDDIPHRKQEVKYEYAFELGKADDSKDSAEPVVSGHVHDVVDFTEFDDFFDESPVHPEHQEESEPITDVETPQQESDIKEQVEEAEPIIEEPAVKDEHEVQAPVVVEPAVPQVDLTSNLLTPSKSEPTEPSHSIVNLEDALASSLNDDKKKNLLGVLFKAKKQDSTEEAKPAQAEVLTPRNIVIMITSICMLFTALIALGTFVGIKLSDNAREKARIEEKKLAEEKEKEEAALQAAPIVLDNPLSQPISARVSDVAWEVPESLAYNDVMREYLQLAGKNIKLNLQNELLLTSEFSYSERVVADVRLAKSGAVLDAKIVSSSGARSIDHIITTTIKDTLKYLQIPAEEITDSSVDLSLVITF